MPRYLLRGAVTHWLRRNQIAAASFFSSTVIGARLWQGRPNAALSGEALELHCALDAATLKFFQTASARLGWSARSFHRVLRIARSVADLAGSATLTLPHVAEAIQCRRMLAGH